MRGDSSSFLRTDNNPSINQIVTVGIGSTSTTTSISSATASTSQSVSQHPRLTASVTPVTASVTVSSSQFGPPSDYATYVSLMRDLSDLSSDDEDFNLAIMASLETEQ